MAVSFPDSDTVVAGGRCLNCGAELEGRYCAECGQKASTGRLTIRSLVGDLLAQISTFDSTVLRTVRELTLRPGRFCREYVAGRRAPFVSPLRYCVSLVAITFLVNTIVGFRPESIVRSAATQLQREMATAVAAVAWRHADLAIFAALPLFAGLVFALFGWRRTTYAETLAFVLFVVGHTFLLAFSIVPLKLLSPPLYFVLRILIQLVYFSWAALGFYRAPRVSGLLRCVLATAAYYAMVALMVILATLPALVDIARSKGG